MRFILRPVTWRKMRSIGVSVRCLRRNTLQPFPEVMRPSLSEVVLFGWKQVSKTLSRYFCIAVLNLSLNCRLQSFPCHLSSRGDDHYQQLGNEDVTIGCTPNWHAIIYCHPDWPRSSDG